MTKPPVADGPGLVQQLYLTPDGQIFESCDSIFAAEHLRGQSVAVAFPVLESCWKSFFQPENADFREFALRGVHMGFPGFDGIFDFKFLKVWFGQREAIYWFVAERTAYYLRHQAEQQRRNERALCEKIVTA